MNNALTFYAKAFKISSKNQTRVPYKFWKTPKKVVTLSIAFAVYFPDFPHILKYQGVLVGKNRFHHAANLRPDMT